jgi:hypothetical protein
MNKREQRSHNSSVDVDRQPPLQRDVFGESFSEKVDPLRHHVNERDEQQHGARNPENRANATAGKARRDMQKETEPAEHQHREDARDNGAFTIFHRYASTVTSVLGFA